MGLTQSEIRRENLYKLCLVKMAESNTTEETALNPKVLEALSEDFTLDEYVAALEDLHQMASFGIWRGVHSWNLDGDNNLVIVYNYWIPNKEKKTDHIDTAMIEGVVKNASQELLGVLENMNVVMKRIIEERDKARQQLKETHLELEASHVIVNRFIDGQIHAWRTVCTREKSNISDQSKLRNKVRHTLNNPNPNSYLIRPHTR